MVTEIDLKAIKEESAKRYLDGDYFCSESIVSTIRKHFQVDMPIEAIAMASGFPVGVGGARCMCGAVSGGVLCIGYFFGRTEPKDKKINKAMKLAEEVLSSFKKNHKVLCCSVHTKNMRLGTSEHMAQCASFTGEVAERTAEIIARELKIKCRK